MNILTHVGAALSSTDSLQSETDGMARFLTSTNRHRADQTWAPRQRRRDRNRRSR
ncbi:MULTISPECIES: hypothetical protein [Iodidimonas]|jgi:hypothetical protein|uniref:Uncharacterized protein n=1 Tax=Iodidimonas nitroreducens TaxID=1236968 RepID=A0A5A7N7I1_9PROT|nr:MULTISPECIES: hypothetical protein [Iodidimonas]GAK33690.1 hypothetical protein AQ1_01580 [alpha proteobacterium Q-1]GER03595.1 hypothetical protein JCM17846_12770 [Iodidimonas nitroreducens]